MSEATITTTDAGITLYLAGMGAGEKRSFTLIRETCERLGGSLPVVAGLFGFFRDTREPSRYRDVFRDSEFSPLIDSAETAEAFSLAMEALGSDQRAMADRVVNKIQRNRAAVHRLR